MIAPPPTVAPPAPFPLVVAQSSAPEFVAPGITRADYRMMTSAGPLVIHVVVLDPQEPTVRVGVVLARDRMISSGETVSSMAARSGAVAGVNGDYFDIGQTNQPLNIVVSNGMLLRTPSRRAALAVATDKTIGIGKFTFSGSVGFNETRIPLTTVNQWPPQGGATLLTPAYGVLAPAADTLVATLEPLDTTAGAPGSYRVAAIGPPRAGPVAGTLLGFGAAARRAGSLPAVDDAVNVAFATEPSLGGLSAAIGGGPQLVAAGAAFDDPDTPAPEERNVRFPVSGALLDGEGNLMLIAVDGRQPAVSMGLTRPEFAALMRGFAASDGMAFDSGGSATLVARVLGDDLPTVMNAPSDGRERPVANGLFVFSDAGRGRSPRLIVRPATFAALPGTEVTLSGVVVDDAGHRLRGAELPPFKPDPAVGDHVLALRDPRSGLSAEVPYRTVDRIATLQILPDRPNPPQYGTIALRALGFDGRGTPVALGDRVVWRVSGRAISGAGATATFRVGSADATVTAGVAGATASTVIFAGNHTVVVGTFATPAGGWRFASLPRGAPGSVALTGGELVLAYDFTGDERAAYANAAIDVPGEPLSFRIEVFGDGNGAALRASFANRFGEPQALTLARRVDWHGWRMLAVDLPASLNAPVKLTALYLLPALAGAPVRAAGNLRFRAPAVVVRGNS